jgi:Xaa-Pro aminopeptidase
MHRLKKIKLLPLSLGANALQCWSCPTAYIGEPPNTLISKPKAVSEGRDEVLDSMKAGALCCDVHATWQAVLDEYGLEKSRIGYSIGVGYSRDWVEHTISFRLDDHTFLPESAVFHIILGM